MNLGSCFGVIDSEVRNRKTGHMIDRINISLPNGIHGG
jgi:hypothetical protein